MVAQQQKKIEVPTGYAVWEIHPVMKIEVIP